MFPFLSTQIIMSV